MSDTYTPNPMEAAPVVLEALDAERARIGREIHDGPAQALTNATLPHAMTLAAMGVEKAARASVHLARGLNTYKGACVCAPVARAHGLSSTDLATLL